MNKKLTLKSMVTVIATIFFIGLIPGMVQANGQAIDQKSPIQAKAALAVDADTGQILYAKNDKQPLAIASISKLMTVYIVHQRIAEHKLSWNTRVKINSKLAKLSTGAELTNVPLVAGKSYTVKELVKAALISSANAAAITLGNAVAGSPEQFNQVMQDTARSMGINDAKFYNAAGLPNKLMGDLELKNVSPNAENMMSAQSVGKIAAKLLKKFPSVTKITSQTSYTFAGAQYEGHNELLGNDKVSPSIKVTGLKTGTSDKAGASFVSSATNRHRRIVTVILHARNTSPTDPARFIQTAKLLREVVANNRPMKLSSKATIANVKTVFVKNAKDQTVKVGTLHSRWIWVPKQSVKVTGQFVKKDKQLSAPITVNSAVAKANLLINGRKITYLSPKTATIALAPTKKVDKANVFVQMFRAVANLF